VAHDVDQPCATEPPRRSSLPIVLLRVGSTPLRDEFSVVRIETRVANGDSEGTTFSFDDVPSHTPHGVPTRSQFGQQNRPRSAFSLGRPSGRDRRGERRPLRRKTSTQPRSTSVPWWDVAPPSKIAAEGAGSYDSAKPFAARREPFLRAGGRHARSDLRSCGRAQRRPGFARCARRAAIERRDLDTASARPVNGNCRSEPNHEMRIRAEREESHERSITRKP
jgi:hypothetical protein